MEVSSNFATPPQLQPILAPPLQAGAGPHTAARRSTEAEAVRLAQQGDAMAFATLYGLHSRRVFAVCRRMSGNQEEAADLTQEVFLLVFRKISSFRGNSAFSTWLHRVTTNTVLMRLRRKELALVSLQELMDPQEPEKAPGDFGYRDERLAATVDRVNLQRAIDTLPAKSRKVLELFDIEGYGHHEIAAMNGYPVSTSKSQLHQARLKLRSVLGGGARVGAPARQAHQAARVA
jgi:RNA polymerase sigma-70 factor (ECF subfamily)